MSLETVSLFGIQMSSIFTDVSTGLLLYNEFIAISGINQRPAIEDMLLNIQIISSHISNSDDYHIFYLSVSSFMNKIAQKSNEETKNQKLKFLFNRLESTMPTIQAELLQFLVSKYIFDLKDCLSQQSTITIYHISITNLLKRSKLLDGYRSKKKKKKADMELFITLSEKISENNAD